MKNIIIMAMLCLMVNPVRSQKIVEKHIDFSQKDFLQMNIQIADSIVIHTWNKEEVYAKAVININDNSDNDAYQTTFSDTGKQVLISANFDKAYFSGKNGNSTSSITWEIFLPEKTEFSVKTISGNVIIDGTISNAKVKSISGFIDVSLPEDTKADVQIKTISGTLYSNYEFGQDSQKRNFTTRIFQKLNGGGNPIDLETISGNIYLRKK